MESLSSSKQFYVSFLDKLVEGNIITTYCKNKLIDMLNSSKPKEQYAFKKYFNNLLELSDGIQS